VMISSSVPSSSSSCCTFSLSDMCGVTVGPCQVTSAEALATQEVFPTVCLCAHTPPPRTPAPLTCSNTPPSRIQCADNNTVYVHCFKKTILCADFSKQHRTDFSVQNRGNS
jgi:hypothetical protein